MKEGVYKKLPHFLQNITISIYNFINYKKRYGVEYENKKKLFRNNEALSKKELLGIQERRFCDFLAYSISKSEFYAEKYKNISLPTKVSEISALPIISKEILRQNIDKIYTINKNQGVLSKTGGTTGKSLEVIYTRSNMQERFAMLDNFRSNYGYKLGKKTAWFSGKPLLTNRDVKKRRFWKTDYIYNVRYYSTFHTKEEYLIKYIENLIKYKPKFMIGFPSTILAIAKIGIKNNLKYPKNSIKAIFPTAETVTKEMRELIEYFFKSRVIDQYASSEGAPFIFECSEGNLHLELQSGVFEVLDENNAPTNKGRLVLTSFTTEGTPLIRYDIGDSLELSEKVKCDCGSSNPIVNMILGRVDDYVFSIDNGKINLGNISNTLKDVKGIIKFQVLQNVLEEITVQVVIDKKVFNKNYEDIFTKNWKERMGDNTKIKLNYVDYIPIEKSGKYRIIKNNIKHLLINEK